MASSMVISDGAKRLNRASLLRKLGLAYDLPFTGDIKDTRSLNLQNMTSVKVHQVHAPFVNFGATFERCSGSTLVRVDRTTVAIPCFSCEVTSGSSVCAHCEEVWNSGPDADGFFALDKKSMKNAAAFYKQGAGNNFFRLPAFRASDEAFSSEIAFVKQLLDGSVMELSADWPGCSFKRVVESVMIDAGVVHGDSGKRTNPYKRSDIEQQRLGDYMTQMVKLWLRVRSYVSLDDLLEQTKLLAQSARKVQAAMRHILQSTMQKQPVYCGAISVADVMLSGFSHAALGFDKAVSNSMDESGGEDLPEFWWGPRVEEFVTWADSVEPVDRPPKRTIPKKQSSSKARAAESDKSASQEQSASASGPQQYYAVAVGRVPGVYTSMDQVRQQTNGLPTKGPDKGKMKIFATQADAEQYVQRFGHAVKASTASASASHKRYLYVAKGGSRPGIYEHEPVAKFYAAQEPVGTVTRVESFAEGRKLLNKPAPPYFRESTVPSQEVIDLSDTSQPNTEGSFFAVLGGTQSGVYDSEVKAFDAVVNGGGKFTPYMTRAEAQQAFDAAQEQTASACNVPELPELAFVVWAGRSVGIMSRKACMKATMGLAGVQMKGPMSANDAFGLWLEKEKVALVLEDKPSKKPKLDSPTPEQAMPSTMYGGVVVDMPDDKQLERAEAMGVTRVFACRTRPYRVRIALSYELAKEGVENAEVTSFFRKQTLIENLAEAELWADTCERRREKKPFAERMKEERFRVFHEHSKTEYDIMGRPKHPVKRAADNSSTDATPGQSQLEAGFVGFKGMVRSRRVLQMQRCFIDCASAIRVDAAGQPNPDELDEDNMELPGSSTYMLSTDRSSGPLGIEAWFEEKKSAIKAWPLMSFSEFLSFCRHAIRLCSQSAKPAAVVNCAALNELMDIAIRLHRHMDRLHTLGPNEVRFKARMFLHLQYATMHRVVFTSASAMAVFKEATEVFMTRLPKAASVAAVAASPRSRKAAHDKYAASPTKSRKQSTPQSGCYLCPATDHYCNDRAFHPLNAQGKYACVSKDVRQKIMKRIEDGNHSAEWKAAEKKRVKNFWERRCESP